MNDTFENKLVRLVDDFIKFSKSEKYLDPYNCPIHINYDVRQALEGIEYELRERINLQEGKRYVKIPFQFIIGFILEKFFKENNDIDAIIQDYIIFRTYREEVQFEICSSKLSKEIKSNSVLLCKEIKKVLDPIKVSKRSKIINLKSFIDYVLNKFIKEYLIGP